MNKQQTGASAQPNPAGIMGLSTAYWGSQVLLAANRLGVFDALAGGTDSASGIAARLGLDVRATRLLLNACVALGLCEMDTDARYANSRASQVFLASGSAASLANAIRYSDDLYATWGELANAVRSGKPAKPAATYLGEDESQTRHFVYGMHNRALGVGRALTGLVNLAGRQRLLDIGGGPGTYAALLTERFPGLQADVLELPGVAAVAREILADMGAAERVRMLDGDYHSSDFGSGYDAVLMSGMFHRETEGNCRALIERARGCLVDNGILVVSDVFVDANRTGPEFATLFGLNMFLTAPDGGVHADADVADWLSGAGFSEVECRSFPPPMPHRIVTGYKT